MGRKVTFKKFKVLLLQEKVGEHGCGEGNYKQSSFLMEVERESGARRGRKSKINEKNNYAYF